MDNNLLSALLNVQPGGHPSPNEHWRVLFDCYNSSLNDGQPRLVMGCRPCFDKVYQFCRTVLLYQLKEGKLI